MSQLSTLPRTIALSLAILGCFAGPSPAADRPIAPKLLPEQTVMYFRIASMPDLRTNSVRPPPAAWLRMKS